jgi:Ca2+-binding RTX toxin-like protein
MEPQNFYGTDINDDTREHAFIDFYGGNGDDVLLTNPAPGFSVMEGGKGKDVVFLSGGRTGEVYGGAGDDAVGGATLGDGLYGGGGNDLVVGGQFAIPLSGGEIREGLGSESGSDRLEGGDGNDALYGLSGNDVVYGGEGNDRGTVTFGLDLSVFTLKAGLFGGSGNDFIDGGRGDDFIVGGAGTDILIGGLGGDVFEFRETLESPKGVTRDIIRDFSPTEQDLIDLSLIDANTKKLGDQLFKFIGHDKFHKTGEVRFDHGKLAGDVNGDGKADFELKLLGVAHLHASDLDL